MGRSGFVAKSLENVVALAMVVFLSVVTAAPGAAATLEPHPREESVVAGSWEVPPQACSGDFDWIQLRNGEWLKGEIKELLRDKFTFESDELDTLVIDWEDIYLVCSPWWNTLVLDNRTNVVGIFHMEGDAVIMETSAGERHFRRADVQSIIPGGTKRRDYWSGKLSLGLSLRSGNTNQADASSYMMIQRRSPMLRTQLGFTGNYGSFEGTETINKQEASLNHDIFVSDKVYLTVPIINYYRDRFQNLDYRLTAGGGAGLQILDHVDLEWSITGGGGYQYTAFSQTDPEEASSANGGALLSSTNLDWELTDRLELNFDYHMMLGLSESIQNTYHALLMISLDLWKDLSFDLSLMWDRIENLQSVSGDSGPKTDDIRMNVGIGWEF